MIYIKEKADLFVTSAPEHPQNKQSCGRSADVTGGGGGVLEDLPSLLLLHYWDPQN